MGEMQNIGGVVVKATGKSLGGGGQGMVELVTLRSRPAINLALKEMPATQSVRLRCEALTKLSLPSHNPYLAGPIACEMNSDKIKHLAPFAAGNDLENDIPRNFPALIEIAHHLACQATTLEELGIAHGDYAPGNLVISSKGEVTLIDLDNYAASALKIPAPKMAGQPHMLAPEMQGKSISPTLQSDRFALAILLNMIVLGRYPAEGMAANPSERNKVMSAGRWPERQRKSEPDETPLQAIGNDLGHLFDSAFSRDIGQRPTADQWRRTLLQALHTLHIHSCGQCFVVDPGQTECPWCQGTIHLASQTPLLKITLQAPAARYSIPLNDRSSVILGRANLPVNDLSVSALHLEITRFGDKVLLRHIGRNPTFELEGKDWKPFKNLWIDMSNLSSGDRQLKLGNSVLILRVNT